MLAFVLTALFAFVLIAPVFAAPPSAYYDFYAGQTIDVGDIQIGNDETKLYINIDIDPKWQIVQTKVAVVTNPNDFPMTGSGNPKVGHFPYNGLNTFTITLPAGVGEGGTLYIAVHSIVLGIGANNLGQRETAWGTFCRSDPDNNPPTAAEFPGNNWATYLIYTVT